MRMTFTVAALKVSTGMHAVEVVEQYGQSRTWTKSDNLPERRNITSFSFEMPRLKRAIEGGPTYSLLNA